MVVLMGLRMCCGMLEAGRVGLLNGDEVLAGLKEPVNGAVPLWMSIVALSSKMVPVKFFPAPPAKNSSRI